MINISSVDEMLKIHSLVLAHDYLIQMGGAERVVASMVRHFPDAPVYTSAVDRQQLWPEFANADIRTTWMQKMPGMPRRFKYYFPFYASAFRSFGLVPCDIAWISASTFAKCLRLPRNAYSIYYCHNPTRFLWRSEEYVEGEVHNHLIKNLARLSFPCLRHLDRQAAWRMNVILANSQNVKKRILECYGREARVVHPPVEVERFEVSHHSDDYYLIVSRLIAYKRIDRAVEAFNQLQRKLVIVGEGPDKARLQALAGPTVTFTGRLEDIEVSALMANCRGFIFPGEEDFGITPVEAQACGKPVIAFARGGALETVKPELSGLWFHRADANSLAEAVVQCEQITWDPVEIRKWAEQFSERVFLSKTDGILEEARDFQDRRWKALERSGRVH